jgi:hypothetical protein
MEATGETNVATDKRSIVVEIKTLNETERAWRVCGSATVALEIEAGDMVFGQKRTFERAK